MSEQKEISAGDKISVPRKQLDELLKQNEEYKQEVKELLLVAYGICNVLGLTDENGKIKQSYLNNEESPMPSVLKAILSTASLMGQANVPILGRKAEAEIAQKFAFIKHLTPIIEKYQNKK